MTSQRAVVLRPGKEKALLNRHLWIFSGAVASWPEDVAGEVLPIYSAQREFLGQGYFNRRSSIAGRLLTFDQRPLPDVIRQHLHSAWQLRQALIDPTLTNCYRFVNGEGDSLPGLVVDRYRDVLVIQIGTLGMERLRPLLVEQLVDLCQPACIYEKSILPSRREEGLKEVEGVVYGKLPETLIVTENGLNFYVSPAEGQKTGFFLDQRLMRRQIQERARGKKVLNCFAYTGGFSVYAAAGGAREVTSVDLSATALEWADRNMQLNGFHAAQSTVADVFKYLREVPWEADLVILDPPAFAKKQKDVVAACRGYKDLNRLAMRQLPSAGLLLTCSCSHHVDRSLFQKVVFQAAVEAGRQVRIIGHHQLAPDHPINICHPESDYLKSLLLYVE